MINDLSEEQRSRAAYKTGSSCDGVIAFCRFLQNPVSLDIPVVNVSEMMHHRVCDSVKYGIS